MYESKVLTVMRNIAPQIYVHMTGHKSAGS